MGQAPRLFFSFPFFAGATPSPSPLSPPFSYSLSLLPSCVFFLSSFFSSFFSFFFSCLSSSAAASSFSFSFFISVCSAGAARAVSEQFPSGSRPVSKSPRLNFNYISIIFELYLNYIWSQSNFQLISEQFQCHFRAVSEEF